jgi:hypothetical protein
MLLHRLYLAVRNTLQQQRDENDAPRSLGMSEASPSASATVTAANREIVRPSDPGAASLCASRSTSPQQQKLNNHNANVRARRHEGGILDILIKGRIGVGRYQRTASSLTLSAPRRSHRLHADRWRRSQPRAAIRRAQRNTTAKLCLQTIIVSAHRSRRSSCAVIRRHRESAQSRCHACHCPIKPTGGGTFASAVLRCGSGGESRREASQRLWRVDRRSGCWGCSGSGRSSSLSRRGTWRAGTATAVAKQCVLDSLYGCRA